MGSDRFSGKIRKISRFISLSRVLFYKRCIVAVFDKANILTIFFMRVAFMRDEGYRYDPALARLCYNIVIELFQRRLGEGDLAATDDA
jgi:dienelactone hydrolase